jgi:hypothetical protein
MHNLLPWITATCLLYTLIAAWALYTLAAETKEYWDVRNILYALFWPITLGVALIQQWVWAGRRVKNQKEGDKEP